MKLERAQLLLAIYDKDWLKAIEIVGKYFDLNQDDLKTYRINIEDYPVKNPSIRVTIYHKKAGFFCWDEHTGWSADGTWRYGRAGTVAIKVLAP